MEKAFYPPRRTGIIFQGSIILLLMVAGGYFFFIATQDPSGLGFLQYMMIALVILSSLPLWIYRFYSLVNATYILRRDGLLIRWGLRREDIPLRSIEWIRPAEELGFRLPMPWLRWPGSILGSRKVPELGSVEFLASDLAHMILVTTPEKIYAISPDEVNQFMFLFQQVNEMGSLMPLQAQSVYPTVLLGRVWEDRLARSLIIVGFGVGLILLIAVAIAVPNIDTLVWTGRGEIAPAERLLLLSVLDGMIWLFNLLLGIFLYRRGSDLRIAAYLLWGSAALTGLLLFMGSLILIF